MRLAHSYVPARDPRAGQLTLPADERAIAAHLSYEQERAGSREEFLAGTEERWMVELRAALRELLEPDRVVLSVGSGRGEHEVPLHLEGYDITASDVLDEALEDARRLFSGLRTRRFDALEGDGEAQYDDVLATGLDYALDDVQFRRFLGAARRVLRGDGRVLLVHRYNDNWVTGLIDRAGLPAWATLHNVLHRVRGDDVRLVRREHGWRRSRAEIRALARESGYRVGRVRYAAFAMELARLPVPEIALRPIVRIDRRLHVLNSATVFELNAP